MAVKIAFKIGEKIVRSLARKFGRAANREGTSQTRSFLAAIAKEGSGTMSNAQKQNYIGQLNRYIAKQTRRAETGTALLPKKPTTKKVTTTTSNKKPTTKKPPPKNKPITKGKVTKGKATDILPGTPGTKKLSSSDADKARDLTVDYTTAELKKLLNYETDPRKIKIIKAAIEDRPLYKESFKDRFKKGGTIKFNRRKI